MPSTIKVENLNVSYNENKVLRDIDLIIPPAKVTAIIGPSGCGKTTLLRCLNRLSEFTKGCKIQGSIYVDDQDIRQMDPMLLRRRIGMVFQKPNPFPKSVKENVLYGVKATNRRNGTHESTVEACLRKAVLWDELKDRLGDSAYCLSLGQQQRLCFARTLAVVPEVILMDEPASSLDPASTSKLESSIRSMSGEYTVVVVTHDMQEARRVSDYTAFLYLGQLVEFGETKQMYENPKSELTKEYFSGSFS
jgi:phosphate transport system ATP-binding protein